MNRASHASRNNATSRRGANQRPPRGSRTFAGREGRPRSARGAKPAHKRRRLSPGARPARSWRPKRHGRHERAPKRRQVDADGDRPDEALIRCPLALRGPLQATRLLSIGVAHHDRQHPDPQRTTQGHLHQRRHHLRRLALPRHHHRLRRHGQRIRRHQRTGHRPVRATVPRHRLHRPRLRLPPPR